MDQKLSYPNPSDTTRWLPLALLAAFLLTPVSLPADQPLDDAGLDQRVREAIPRMVSFLYDSRNDKGHWDIYELPDLEKIGPKDDKKATEANRGGYTALALNALASAGERNDKRFKDALEWLMKQKLYGTYALGLRLELIARLDAFDKYRRVAEADYRELLASARGQLGTVTWSYFDVDKHSDQNWEKENYWKSKASGDYSNTNYALLGFWGYHHLTNEIPGRQWQLVERAWTVGQHPNGAWSYVAPKYHDGLDKKYAKPAGTMTAAGIASLYIVLDSYYGPRSRLGAHRKTLAFRSVQKGLEWMAENFDVEENPGRGNNAGGYYYYNCERVAHAAGLKYFGDHDWFREIAPRILASQANNGGVFFGKKNPRVNVRKNGMAEFIPNTAFSLMFLHAGAAPVVMNKLRQDGDWDNNLTDLSSLTRWLAKKNEHPVNWQVVRLDGDKTTAEQATDSRMLYISGVRPLKFDEKVKARLKRYVQLGGMLVFHPDLPGHARTRAFRDSVKDLLSELWPKLELQPVNLKEHLLGTIQYELDDPRLDLRVLQTPTRVLAVVLDGAPADAWKQQDSAGRDKVFFELGQNLHMFANDRAAMKDLPSKVTYFAQIFREEMPETSRSVSLARIQFDDNPHLWNPEPLAFERFRRQLARDHAVDCKIEVIQADKLGDSSAKVAHLTASSPLDLTDEQIAGLRRFVQAGGVLLIDRAGGPGKNNDSFDKSIARLAGKVTGESVDTMPRMLSSGKLLDGLGEISYRNIGVQLTKSLAPRLRQVRMNEKPAVIYSEYDLTSGLLGNPNPLITGAAPDGAQKLMSHLLLKLHGIDPAAAKPASQTENRDRRGR